METLTFNINKTNISLVSTTFQAPYLTGKNTDYQCVFTWSSEWDDLVKAATFRNLHTNIARIQLLTNGACFIPYDVMDYGDLEIGLIGLNSEDRIIKSSRVYRVTSQHNAGDNAEESETPESSLVEQILEQYAHILETVGSLIVPTVTVVQDIEGEYQLQFTDQNGAIVTPNLIGARGQGFAISKTYASIAAMNADFNNPDLSEGDFVIITSNVDDEDNAKLYVKGSSSFSFITDMSGAQGIQGERGYTGNGIASVTLSEGYLTLNYTNGTHSDPLYIKGETGETGGPGPTGSDGKSAYQVARDNGFSGTTAEWLASLVGEPGAPGQDGSDGAAGKSAYQVALDNGFVGNEAAWLASLVGATGDTGNGIAYASYDDGQLTLHYTNGQASADFDIKGETGSPGQDGSDGSDGKSAFEIAQDNGFVGSEAAWLASLVGATGRGIDSVSMSNGSLTINFTDNTSSDPFYIKGDTGDTGKGIKSASVSGGYLTLTYSDNTTSSPLYVQGETGTPGTDGSDGADGKSAFEIAQDNGFSGSASDWLASLVGATGATGKGIKSASVSNGYLTLTYTDDTTSSAFYVKGDTGAAGQDGNDGQDYVLTNQDKSDIAALTLGLLTAAEGVSY